MFAVYASGPNLHDPISAVVVGELPSPAIPPGWVQVRVSHASLNRHDIFTLRGISAQKDPIPFPMILGNDGVGTLDDGSEVIIYPVLGSADWRGDETLDPGWHVLSELVPGTMADYIALPARNVIPMPAGLSAAHASVLGTAWLTAYRALFITAGLVPGSRVLVQGASGGMATALIQMGHAAGIEVWVASRNERGRQLAEKLGANRIFNAGEQLPMQVDAVIDNVGRATWSHTLSSVRRGGTVVINGVTTGQEALTDLLPLFANSITIRGAIMGTLEEMKRMINFVINAKLRPEIGHVVPMTEARESIRAMIAGDTHGKTVFTRPRGA
jgi:NADPH:quinone reductase-like Zn-dependent oxidoreductase